MTFHGQSLTDITQSFGRSNAVFLLVSGRAEHPVGAELRGSGPRIWRGLAPGTKKEAGYF
jgi:hypothetical protein